MAATHEMRVRYQPAYLQRDFCIQFRTGTPPPDASRKRRQTLGTAKLLAHPVEVKARHVDDSASWYRRHSSTTGGPINLLPGQQSSCRLTVRGCFRRDRAAT